MKIALCFFSFSKDRFLLAQALRALPRLRQDTRDEIHPFIFDDSASPIGQDFFAGQFINYSLTSFNRCGNLNGTACVQGMAQCFRQVFDAVSPDFLIKADSDCFINDFNFLRTVDPASVGGGGNFSELHFAHGCLYAITARGLAEIEYQLSRTDIVARMNAAKNPVNEDRIFSLLIRMRGLGQFCLDAFRNRLENSRACYQDINWATVKRLENPSYEKMLKHCGVSFKEHTYRTRSEEERDANRADALIRMQAYADWATQQPLLPDDPYHVDPAPDPTQHTLNNEQDTSPEVTNG